MLLGPFVLVVVISAVCLNCCRCTNLFWGCFLRVDFLACELKVIERGATGHCTIVLGTFRQYSIFWFINSLGYDWFILCLAFKIKIIETAFKGDMQPLVAVATIQAQCTSQNKILCFLTKNRGANLIWP